MVNQCVKFEDNSFNSMEVTGKVKRFHITRTMSMLQLTPRLYLVNTYLDFFFLSKPAKLKLYETEEMALTVADDF